MSVQWVKVMLRMWRPGGKVALADFVRPLQLQSSDPYGKFGAEDDLRSTGLIVFAELQSSEHPDSFDDAIQAKLAEVGRWLQQRPRDGFEFLHKRSIKTDLLIPMWIDSDQMDLALPPILCAACGDRGIPILVYSNE